MEDVSLVCFGLDDTLIKQNSWYTLNLALGLTPEEDQYLYNVYAQGNLDYHGWMEQLVAHYHERGRANRAYITNVLADYELMPGTEAVFKQLQTKGYTLAIISGSFDILVAAVAKRLGVVHYRAMTAFVFDDADHLVRLDTQGDEAAAKLAQLQVLCNELSVPITACACVGDGANDLPMFWATGRGVTFVGSPVADQAWHTISTLSDIPQLL